MLSRELGTHLTGRYRQIELFPFNYQEFLQYFNFERSAVSFEKYFSMGGFPEFYEENNTDYLRTLMKDIIIRDIAVRRKIANENQLIRLAVHLMSNIGKEFSFNNVGKSLEFKSVRTVIDYCDYLRESYLVELIPQFSFSIRKQQANAKKTYCIDTALASANSLSFSKDLGRKLENIVFNKLRNKSKEIFYFKTGNSECDFLIKQQEQIDAAIQVCWEINNENLDRELKGIKSAIKETGALDAKIITLNQEDNLDGIPVIPVWKWL
jgi:predicted AAA+ superfamily ATPase